MSLRSVFMGPAGLRSGWRVLLFLGLSQAASAVLMLAVLKGLHYQPAEGWVASDFMISETVGLVVALLATAVMARVTRRPMGEFGLPLAPGAAKLWAAGVLLGFAVVLVLVGAITAAGGMSFHGWALQGSGVVRAALRWGLVMILLGLFEEYMFRGYVLVTLAEGMQFWPAAALLSALFGALHYFTKPMETLADAVTVGLIALLLCFSFRRTGSLWLAAGFHAAFDFGALILFGAPNTGNQGKPVADRLLATEFHGPAWLTGGVCGMEASWLILPVLAAAYLAIHLLYKRPA